MGALGRARIAPSVENGEPSTRPVLLVPGFSGQDLVYWNVFRRRLERDGFQAFTLTLPGLALQDIRTSSTMLARRVDEILDATGADRIDLIGHSLGGLAMRHYIQEADGADKVGRCASLGTPHQGTLSALPALLRPAGRQLLPGSAFLRKLDSHPVPRPWTNVYSPRDSLVIPYRNAHLPGADNHKIGFGGHWGLLVRDAAYRPIRTAFRGPPEGTRSVTRRDQASRA